MDQTVGRPLTFKSVKGRFRLIEVNYTAYTDGTGFFSVARPDNPQPFPFAPSFRCFLGNHSDEETIPLPVIENWMARLGLNTQERGTFWKVDDLGQPLSVQNSIKF